MTPKHLLYGLAALAVLALLGYYFFLKPKATASPDAATAVMAARAYGVGSGSTAFTCSCGVKVPGPSYCSSACAGTRA